MTGAHNILGITDVTVLREIAAIYDVVDRVFRGPDIDPVLTKRMIKIGPYALLFRAAESLQSAGANLTAYESKRLAVKAFHTTSRMYNRIFLVPEPGMIWVDDPLPAPLLDPHYERFFRIECDYWRDPQYGTLCE